MARPKTDLSHFLINGRFHFWIVLIFFTSGLIPSFVTTWPKNSICCRATSFFLWNTICYPLAFKAYLKVSYILFCRLGIHQNIIDVDHHKIIHHLSKNGVWKFCECRWCITQSEWHEQEFTRPISYVTCHFFHIFIPQFEFDSTLILSLYD